MTAHQLDSTTTVVFADIAVILIVGSLLMRIAKTLRQPPVVAELLAGVVLGPSLLGLLPGHLSTRLFPMAARPFLSVVSQLGILLFMFLMGWEFNRDLLRGRLRTTILSVSLSAVAVPFLSGAALAMALYSRHNHVGGHHVGRSAFVLYLGTALSVTAFPVLARFLTDTRMSGTRVGKLALASAAAGDALAWMLLAVVVAVVQVAAPAGLLRMIGQLILYGIVMAAVVRPALNALIRRWSPERARWSLLAVIGAGVLLSAAATSWMQIHAIFGAFIFGCMMPRNPGTLIIQHVRVPLEHVSMLLIPVFFIQIGLSVNIRALTGGDLVEAAAVVVVACVAKLLGAGVPGRITGLNWRDAGTLGVLMNMRGLTELIVLNVGVSMAVLDQRMYTMMVLMALLTTAAAGLIIRYRPPATTLVWPWAEAELQLTQSAAMSERGPIPSG